MSNFIDKDYENFIRNALKEGVSSRNYKAVLDSHKFWQAEDFYHHSNKANIFKSMYMSQDNFNNRLFKLCRQYFVDERTLFRYRLDFVLMYKYFLQT